MAPFQPKVIYPPHQLFAQPGAKKDLEKSKKTEMILSKLNQPQPNPGK
jgi:hypothetical protein